MSARPPVALAQQPLSLAGKILVLNGPPAAGKGSVAQRLSRATGCVHLSTGDIFRDHVARNTELGKQAKPYLDADTFVPDDLAINFVFDRVSQPDCVEHGAVVDGFPRTAAQARALAASRVVVNRVINIQCPDAVLPAGEVEARVVARKLDGDIQQRLDVYRAQHRRFTLDNAVNVNGNKALDLVFADVCRILREDAETETEARPTLPTAAATGECAICMDQPANHLVTPCGHQCGCKGCLEQLQRMGGTCPVCRGAITTIQRVFAAAADSAPASTAAAAAASPSAARGVPDMVGGPPAGGPGAEAVAEVVSAVAPGCPDDEWPEDAPDTEDDGDFHDAAADAPAPSGITVRVAPTADVCGLAQVVIEITTPEAGRTPVDICAVIDVSGSMCSAAAVENDDGTKDDDGLSVLDLVKHSVKAVVNCLGPNDRLSIVPFSNTASVHHPLSYMTPDGVAAATAALEQLRPSGSTNIWAGLKTGMDSLRSSSATATSGGGNPPGAPHQDRKAVVMLLTDGCPNICPPAGHLQELQNYRDATDFSVQINTFGFGYNLDSKLLHGLAVAGAGTYAFIPDAKIVGTTFVDSVANVLSTLTHSATLHLTEKNGAAFSGVAGGSTCYGGNESSNEDWGTVVDLGPLSHGQTRYVSVPMHIPALGEPAVTATTVPYLEAVLQVGGHGGTTSIQVSGAQRAAAPEMLAGHLTAKAATIGQQAISTAEAGKGQSAVDTMQVFAAEVSRAATAEGGGGSSWDQQTADSRVLALHKDVSGRMSKALMGQARFNRWGKHYLRALVRAHQLNLCTNFMDAGLQVNGGDLFRSLRATGDEAFVNLPAPMPSRARGGSSSSRTVNPTWALGTTTVAAAAAAAAARTPAPAPAVDMSSYYCGSGGGCFGPTSTVQVQVQERVPGAAPSTSSAAPVFRRVLVSAVKRGDMVQTAAGLATVACVARVARNPAKRLVRLPGGLTITGGHPVRRRGVWCLPRDQTDAKDAEGSGTVYTFVLDECVLAGGGGGGGGGDGRVLLVDGTACVTWGHGIADGVAKHAFFGTGNAVEALAALPGYADGLVDVGGFVRRAGPLGEVVGLRAGAAQRAV